MIEPLSDTVITQLSRAGLERPRPSYPGQTWAPRTRAEEHLWREATRLERARQLLLTEIGRLRQETGSAGIVPPGCPLTRQQLAIIAAAAAGETPEATASRLCLTRQTIKSHRRRAVLRLHARNMQHAIALCALHGWVTARQIEQGVTP